MSFDVHLGLLDGSEMVSCNVAEAEREVCEYVAQMWPTFPPGREVPVDVDGVTRKFRVGDIKYIRVVG